MIRDYNQNLYFAEQEGSNRTDIINVFLDPETGINRKAIHHLHGCSIVAMEIDGSNLQNDRGEAEVKKSILILDSLCKVHHVWCYPDQNSFSARVISLA